MTRSDADFINDDRADKNAAERADENDDERNDERAHWRAWHRAATSEPVASELPRLYAQLDVEIASYEPKCFTSGRCCQFDTFEHRLYVTALEAAWFVSRLDSMEAASPLLREGAGVALPVVGQAGASGGGEAERMSIAERMLAAPGEDACPFQVDRKCTAHAIRPHGCRIFYCQQGSEVWQQDLYEKYLGRLRQMHDALGLAYRYIEWRYALQQAATHLHIA